MYEVMFTQVLLTCKALETKGACVGLDSEVCGVDVSAEIEFSHKGLGAVGIVAKEVNFGGHILLIAC